MTSPLSVTQIGRKVATSGLCPEAAAFFLATIPSRWMSIGALLPLALEMAEAAPAVRSPPADTSDLAFALFHLCLASPEYDRAVPPPPRFPPYQLGERHESERASRLQDALTVRPWDRNVFAVNGADLAVDWISGTPLRDLEGRFPDLRGGSLTGLFRDLGQMLAGIAELLVAATNPNLPEEERLAFPEPDAGSRQSIRRLVNILRRLCVRLERGLPDEVLWMAELRRTGNTGTGQRMVPNSVAMALSVAGFASPDSILDRGRTSDMQIALRSLLTAPVTYVNEVRDAVRAWRTARALELRDRQIEQVPDDCKSLVRNFYVARDTALEDRLHDILNCLRIQVADRDAPGKTSFPDFVLNVLASNDIVIECKSRQDADGEVTFNDATEVIRKAHIHGFRNAHKVTLCQPMLSPDVVRKIDECPDLSFVNIEDLAEGLLRLYRQKIDLQDFVNWLTTPGQLKRQDLPYRAVRA